MLYLADLLESLVCFVCLFVCCLLTFIYFCTTYGRVTGRRVSPTFVQVRDNTQEQERRIMAQGPTNPTFSQGRGLVTSEQFFVCARPNPSLCVHGPTLLCVCTAGPTLLCVCTAQPSNLTCCITAGMCNSQQLLGISSSQNNIGKEL